jgi:hypothetical protein
VVASLFVRASGDDGKRENPFDAFRASRCAVSSVVGSFSLMPWANSQFAEKRRADKLLKSFNYRTRAICGAPMSWHPALFLYGVAIVFIVLLFSE